MGFFAEEIPEISSRAMPLPATFDQLKSARNTNGFYVDDFGNIIHYGGSPSGRWEDSTGQPMSKGRK